MPSLRVWLRYSLLSTHVLTYLRSILLQRGVQDRDQLCGIPQQLFHAHRYRKRILLHIRA